MTDYAPRAQLSAQSEYVPSLWEKISYKHQDLNKRQGPFNRPVKTGP